jgi:RNA polymerase sigma-70 factor (ECF subfamily)
MRHPSKGYSARSRNPSCRAVKGKYCNLPASVGIKTAMPATARTSSVAPAPRPLLPELSDRAAVEGVLGGHREMFEIIVRRYNPQLYRVGMAYLRNHAKAEDAMQDAYLKAFLNLSRFRGTATFGTWLTRIMINECLMQLRRQRRFAMESIDDGSSPLECAAFATPAVCPLRDQEMKALLEEALQTLPRNHRAVYLLRDVQGLSTAETAASLNLSPENVKVSLHRARENLKTRLLNNAAGLELFEYAAHLCDPMTAKVMALVASQPTASATR